MFGSQGAEDGRAHQLAPGLISHPGPAVGGDHVAAGIETGDRLVGRVLQHLRLPIHDHPNYGDRYRHGEPISTAMAESAVNQIISTRFVKTQQMKWTERGAHLLLQVRTHVLNGDLRDLFCRWYPGMQTSEEPVQHAA